MRMGTLDRTSEELEEAAKQASSAIGKRDFLKRVGEIVQESGGLLDPEVAALVVLDELGLAQPAEIVAPHYAKVLPPEDLEPGLDGIVVEGKLLGMEPTRTFSKKDGGTGFVTNARVKGEHGIYHITLWDDHIKSLVGIEPGTQIRMDGLYTKERDGTVEAHTGRDAVIKVLDEGP